MKIKDVINTSFLLNEKETVEMQEICGLNNRRWEYSLFFWLFGLYFIIPAVVNLFTGVMIIQSWGYIVAGMFFAAFYDLFILRVLTKKRAKKNYELHINHNLSAAFHMDQEYIEINSDKYRLSVRPQDVWKCVDSSRLFIVYISSERYFSIPKRVLTQQEVNRIRHVFEQALPEGQFVNYGG